MLEKAERRATVWSYLLQPPLAVSKARTTSYLHLLNLGCPCKKLYKPGFSSCTYKIPLFTNKPTQRSGILFPLELCFVLMLSLFFFFGRLQVSVKIQVKYYYLFQRGKLPTSMRGLLHQHKFCWQPKKTHIVISYFYLSTNVNRILQEKNTTLNSKYEVLLQYSNVIPKLMLQFQ